MFLKLNNLLIISVISVLNISCSNQQIFESLKKRQEVLCQQVPASEYEECMENTKREYEEYDKTREQIIKE